MKPAEFGRHHRLEQPGLAQRRDPRPASLIDVVVGQRRQPRIRPPRQRLGKPAVVVVEERQRESGGECCHRRSPI